MNTTPSTPSESLLEQIIKDPATLAAINQVRQRVEPTPQQEAPVQDVAPKAQSTPIEPDKALLALMHKNAKRLPKNVLLSGSKDNSFILTFSDQHAEERGNMTITVSKDKSGNPLVKLGLQPKDNGDRSLQDIKDCKRQAVPALTTILEGTGIESEQIGKWVKPNVPNTHFGPMAVSVEKVLTQHKSQQPEKKPLVEPTEDINVFFHREGFQERFGVTPEAALACLMGERASRNKDIQGFRTEVTESGVNASLYTKERTGAINIGFTRDPKTGDISFNMIPGNAQDDINHEQRNAVAASLLDKTPEKIAGMHRPPNSYSVSPSDIEVQLINRISEYNKEQQKLMGEVSAFYTPVGEIEDDRIDLRNKPTATKQSALDAAVEEGERRQAVQKQIIARNEALQEKAAANHKPETISIGSIAAHHELAKANASRKGADIIDGIVNGTSKKVNLLDEIVGDIAPPASSPVAPRGGPKRSGR